MTSLIGRWSGYWFRPAPLLDLAVVRLFAVGFQLWFLGAGFPGALAQHASAQGVAWEPLPVLQLLLLPFGSGFRPGPEVVDLVYRGTWVVGWLALVGLFSRATLPAFATGTLFLHAYNYSFGDWHHPDAIMMVALVALAASPSGAVLSVDHLIRRLRMNSAGARFTARDLADAQSEFARWPLLLIRWMFALVYLSAALSKLSFAGWGNFDWANGETLRYYLLQDGLRWDRPLGVWAAQLPTLLLVALSWTTLLVEGLFFLVLLVPKLALLFVPAVASMHLFIWFSMRAGFFSYLALYSAFLPSAAIVRWLQARANPARRMPGP